MVRAPFFPYMKIPSEFYGFNWSVTSETTSIWRCFSTTRSHVSHAHLCEDWLLVLPNKQPVIDRVSTISARGGTLQPITAREAWPVGMQVGEKRTHLRGQ
ncbi:hypothetical protein MHYP_G00007400 [Metynnis hypsauchen]